MTDEQLPEGVTTRAAMIEWAEQFNVDHTIIEINSKLKRYVRHVWSDYPTRLETSDNLNGPWERVEPLRPTASPS